MSRSLIPPLWQYFGLNVGNNVVNGDPYDLNTIQADAAYHKSLGITHVRTGGVGYIYTNSGQGTIVTRLRTIAQVYKDLGFNVQYVLGLSDWTDIQIEQEAYVDQEATWAQSVGIDRFQIANELEINVSHGQTETDVYNYLQTLPAIVTGAGYTGTITYSVSQDHFSAWTSGGLGNYDDLGLDVYGNGSADGGIANFKVQIANIKAISSTNTYVSEWGLSSGNYNLLDSGIVNQRLTQRLNALKDNFTRPCYLHCWRFNNGGTTLGNSLDFWASKKKYTDETRLFWFDITNQRRTVFK